jgi:predicted cobalt transporter CbtA
MNKLVKSLIAVLASTLLEPLILTTQAHDQISKTLAHRREAAATGATLATAAESETATDSSNFQRASR